MIAYRKKVFLLLLLSAILVSCSSRQDYVPLTLLVPSLDENYSLLLEEAHKWKTDAYLNEATIRLFPETTYAIRAIFYSSSQDKETLGVYILWDGTITSEILSHQHSIYQHSPIQLNDWKIDSQNILEFVSNPSLRHTLESHSAVCSSLKLYRSSILENQSLVWSLYISDCVKPPEILYLDPNTGEILDSLKNIKPIRIPTKIQ